jgi:8-oxo-dGTP diphosphatase
MSDINQRIACKAVIGMGDKVLVLREASTYVEGTQTGRWHCPGGRINPGEPFVDGLKREIAEETGLTITSFEPFYVGEWFPVIKGQKNQIVAIFFACTTEATPDSVRLSDEHDSFRWVTADEAAALDIMPPEQDVIAHYFNR